MSNKNNYYYNFKPGGGGVRADGDAECHEEDDEEEPQEDLHPVVAPPGAVGHRLHAGLAQERLRKNSNFEFYFIYSIVWDKGRREPIFRDSSRVEPEFCWLDSSQLDSRAITRELKNLKYT